MSFGDVKQPIYGSYGEFNIQNGSSTLRVNYVQTKIKPGSSGWESELANIMVPWREIFNLEDMTFDELLQRDLDDSRVAHDLIPYLLRDDGHKAKFFPPILAVLVPIREDKSGIEDYYPEIQENNETVSSGDLFNFNPVKIKDVISPLGKLEYDRLNTSFVIVDGQHRAMAVLALHRQLNKSWNGRGGKYQSFYNHIEVSPEQFGHVELPVCILYFPDLFEGNNVLADQGVNLKNICRDIFLVVNKHAKKVSSTRELLLDDNDFCARMMRATLSKLKNRGEDDFGLSRIYSFSYGDEDDQGKILKGQEYSTASFVHKFHAAISFSQIESLNIVETSEVTDGRRVQNSTRPPGLLKGTKFQSLNSLSRLSAKNHTPEKVAELVNLLGSLVDEPLFYLYDKFKMFSIYNASLHRRKSALSQAHMKSQPVQAKSYELMFEGAGARSVFRDHKDRLVRVRDELRESGSPVPDHIEDQLVFTNSALNAFDESLHAVREDFACKLFNFDKDKVEISDLEGYVASIKKGRDVFSAFQTQAFQMGYMMLVHTILHRVAPNDADYKTRLEYLSNISEIVIQALNAFYSEGDSTHKTISGLIQKDRIDTFSPSGVGLRGLLTLSGALELNERQWVFFRYALLEIIHSKYSRSVLLDAVSSLGTDFEESWKSGMEIILEQVNKIRKGYVDKSVHRAVESTGFEMEKMQMSVKLKAEGKTQEDIDEDLSELISNKEEEVKKLANAHLKASLGSVINDVYADVYN